MVKCNYTIMMKQLFLVPGKQATTIRQFKNLFRFHWDIKHKEWLGLQTLIEYTKASFMFNISAKWSKMNLWIWTISASWPGTPLHKENLVPRASFKWQYMAGAWAGAKIRDKGGAGAEQKYIRLLKTVYKWCTYIF